MSDKDKKQASTVSWGLIALVVIFLSGAAYIIVNVLSGEGPRRRDNVATVTLLKPPPVQVKEKLPEPEPVKEMQKKEEIVDPTQGPKDEPQNNENDNTPAGDKLGLDAEGKAGGDSFGLVGKKGGRSILSGDGGGGMGRLSLLSKFGWYTQIVETEIRKKVMKRLDENGGIPRGKLQAIVQISVNSTGSIVKYKIIGSSGNHKMDEAVKQSIGDIKISEPPPDGMPRTMSIRVTSQS
jgi:TonB family protein